MSNVVQDVWPLIALALLPMLGVFFVGMSIWMSNKEEMQLLELLRRPPSSVTQDYRLRWSVIYTDDCDSYLLILEQRTDTSWVELDKYGLFVDRSPRGPRLSSPPFRLFDSRPPKWQAISLKGFNRDQAYHLRKIEQELFWQNERKHRLPSLSQIRTEKSRTIQIVPPPSTPTLDTKEQQ